MDRYRKHCEEILTQGLELIGERHYHLLVKGRSFQEILDTIDPSLNFNIKKSGMDEHILRRIMDITNMNLKEVLKFASQYNEHLRVWQTWPNLEETKKSAAYKDKRLVLGEIIAGCERRQLVQGKLIRELKIITRETINKTEKHIKALKADFGTLSHDDKTITHELKDVLRRDGKGKRWSLMDRSSFNSKMCAVYGALLRVYMEESAYIKARTVLQWWLAKSIEEKMAFARLMNLKMNGSDSDQLDCGDLSCRLTHLKRREWRLKYFRPKF